MSDERWVSPWPEDWNFGALDPWEDWRWESLPLSPEYLLYLRDAEIDRLTTTPIAPSPS